MKIALDNGHGIETSGKRSPLLDDDIIIRDPDCIIDGRFREFLFNRKIVNMLCDYMKGEEDIELIKIVPTSEDVPLLTRVHRINGINPDLAISIHADAIGGGEKFEKANGFAIWTARGQTRADKYADVFYEKFEDFFKGEIKIRKDLSDGDSDYEANFAIFRCKCPAILIETLFQTNKIDVQMMMDTYFQDNFVKVLYNGIIGIYNKYFLK